MYNNISVRSFQDFVSDRLSVLSDKDLTSAHWRPDISSRKGVSLIPIRFLFCTECQLIDSSVRQCQLIRGMPGYKSYTECFPNKPVRTSGAGVSGVAGPQVAGTSTSNNALNPYSGYNQGGSNEIRDIGR